MDVALCYESVLPARGGAETYIGDLSRRLSRDGHAVHLYACRWDAAALPAATHFHRLDVPSGPRFLRPWRFGAACEAAVGPRHDVSIGFDKTWGQDVLYPQGGLHAASAAHNLLKFSGPVERAFARLGKCLDPAAWSFARLEKKQYLGPKKPLIVVNSHMVRRHFEEFYGLPPEEVRVVRSAIDPMRFAAEDRLKQRSDERDRWGVGPGETVGLFVAMNYRLKGLAPLLNAYALTPNSVPNRLVVVGHPKFQRYERQARRLGIADRVVFLGHRSDPKSCYFAADYLVHPTFYDPCSLVALEALACGLPVITTRYNGASELLSPPTDGVVVSDPHDALELAAAMAKMFDRGYLREASAAARATGSRWTFEHHYQALLSVFSEVRLSKRAA
ncbi:glycosyl transferase group 1 : Glycosyl transferase group 1 OS=Isosphaera pallida (strain ATCC 43644 / DSM 9630 / IS1B) GN=Isop_0825 PE=4 SV=1: Glyco_transf_4: Glycos_transf_1 [Gemmataceae bacterium]|nr:glycosyl transferase group 1 : Glycosyl transferase group 1 OS=Isosphaera pallida (strain ATCC 43644 / DSM 9630 / IS1B) GN=Isop_0825 PE=4 SV=1: Glyco_transf_4: Glycos_transf_1 [Gemmataceae bacterium]VTT97345.1 glycosyl transferase group 1 : Glycosyl transferase group 1 OS=Isosphaera pallida (strain ATCC 43644 / DSM 9630 / IS1B) GN=Isop_0825 PE=4 SV=1: Glyco_transf_4: Glycos_transf_1 [Gemmataceae bacterium]